MRYVRAFALFWWDFIVGDDHWIAAGIVLTLALCAVLSHSTVPVWWVPPVAVLGLLAWSAVRAAPHQ